MCLSVYFVIITMIIKYASDFPWYFWYSLFGRNYINYRHYFSALRDIAEFPFNIRTWHYFSIRGTYIVRYCREAKTFVSEYKWSSFVGWVGSRTTFKIIVIKLYELLREDNKSIKLKYFYQLFIDSLLINLSGNFNMALKNKQESWRSFEKTILRKLYYIRSLIRKFSCEKFELKENILFYHLIYYTLIIMLLFLGN